MAAWGTTCMLHKLENYTFGVKDEQPEKDANVHEKFDRLREKYEKTGVRQSVAAVLLVHQHRHPHLLLLQNKSSFFRLPGGRMRSGEDEIACLKRKLSKKLGVENDPNNEIDWEIGELLSTWWRPGFEPYMYPYLPAHITKPKEVLKVFLVHLPSTATFAIPKNYTLLAIPLFELFDKSSRYGQLISSIPHVTSRINAVVL